MDYHMCSILQGQKSQKAMLLGELLLRMRTAENKVIQQQRVPWFWESSSVLGVARLIFKEIFFLPLTVLWACSAIYHHDIDMEKEVILW